MTIRPPVATVVGMHLELAALEAGLDHIRRSPTKEGRVELIARRPAEDRRETPSEVHLDSTAGLTGDRWLQADGDPDCQVTVMNARVVALVAESAERWALAGDQLYVDLDLSGHNLPTGTELQVGSAILQVTAQPHRGCKKFAGRFGLDALRFVNSPVGYALNLRGINTRVVRSGLVRVGDVIRKLPSPDAESKGTDSLNSD